jgi:hypothetical protein
MSFYRFFPVFISVIFLASTTFCGASPMVFTSGQPPVSQEIYDGSGGKFLTYTYSGIVRLQHIDDMGYVWPASKLLIEAQHPMAVCQTDPAGNVWVLTYHLDQDPANRTAWVQCYDRIGKNNFSTEHVTLQLSGTPQMQIDGTAGITITTEHQIFRIDAIGNLTLTEPTPIPIEDTNNSGMMTKAFVPTPISYGYAVGQEALVPFQFAQDQHNIEITTYLDQDAVKEVVIRLENALGVPVYEFSGLIGNDYYNWIVPTRQLASGTYYLSMRLGEREQVEQIRI